MFEIRPEHLDAFAHGQPRIWKDGVMRHLERSSPERIVMLTDVKFRERVREKTYPS